MLEFTTIQNVKIKFYVCYKNGKLKAINRDNTNELEFELWSKCEIIGKVEIDKMEELDNTANRYNKNKKNCDKLQWYMLINDWHCERVIECSVQELSKQ